MAWISIEFVPLSGKQRETLFQKEVEDLHIVFGALRDCDVCIEEDMQPKVASRDHCAIERSGDFKLIYKAKNPVWLDGKLVTGPQVLFPGDVYEHWMWLAQRPPVDPPDVKLRESIDPDQAGFAGRGHFRCVLEDKTTVAPPAGWRRRGSGGETEDRRTRRDLQGTNRLIIASAGVMSLVVGAGIGFFVRPALDSIQQAQAETNRQIEAERKATEELLNPVLETTAFRERAEKSIYVVGSIGGGKFTPWGTAWVADLGGSPRLVSNHHVGDLLKGAAVDTGARIVARRTVGPGRTEDIDLNPAYAGHPAFDQFASVLDVLRSQGDSWPNLFDVAELPVKDEADRSRLGPALPIAEELAELRPLQSVGYIGFPVEGLNVTKLNPDEPGASFVPGKIIKVTDAFQRQLVPDEYRNLVQIQLTAVGGASGSPLFDGRGRVIGMISGGDVRAGSPNAGGDPGRQASGFVYAIRADVIQELGGRPAPEDRQAQWDCALERFGKLGAGACGAAPEAGVTPDGKLDEKGHAQKRIRLEPGRYVVKAQAASPALLHLKASWGNGRSTESDSEPTAANRPELNLRLTQATEVTFDLQGVPGDDYSLSHQLAASAGSGQ